MIMEDLFNNKLVNNPINLEAERIVSEFTHLNKDKIYEFKLKEDKLMEIINNLRLNKSTGFSSV